MRWTITSGRIPRGIQLNTATGALIGVPLSSGRFRITVTVSDNTAGTSSKTYKFSIKLGLKPKKTK